MLDFVIAFVIAFGTSLGIVGTIFFCMDWAVKKTLLEDPIYVLAGEYRIMYSQHGWSFVEMSIQKQESLFGFKKWKTVYAQERAFGVSKKMWGYSMNDLQNNKCNLDDISKEITNAFTSLNPMPVF